MAVEKDLPHTCSQGEKGQCPNEARRDFLKYSSILTAFAFMPNMAVKAADLKLEEKLVSAFEKVNVTLNINGKKRKLSIEPRTTLLDLLREQLNLTGTKKGCDYGQCGACTVHVDGQRVLSCLSLAAMQDGKKITTIEGLADGHELHPMQAAFIKHDGFQCGYCTPGQIMSAVACIREGHADSDDEIREYMSGNICRCGAYPNIVNAIKEVKNGGQKV
ncbi:(2Fe-2S)-binding protein [Pontibacter arcticus]|uniref:(2Fe-2S)-binding protein n=1 Tax=Pontibacter arcticus TaxID=2080288 RepID=A0A364RC54_9BACT|nr:(2Fe-2S)-binding protein [Pontibacter arcticus]RAU81854.1 (2Fe-2S)-binding protein [Pontibacter arcticus]